jgi:hypothetical protein
MPPSPAKAVALCEKLLASAKQYVSEYETVRHDIRALLAAKASLVKLEGAIESKTAELQALIEEVWDYTLEEGPPDLSYGAAENFEALEYIADEEMRPITVWRDELVKPLQDLLRTLKTTPLPEPEEEEEEEAEEE